MCFVLKARELLVQKVIVQLLTSVIVELLVSLVHVYYSYVQMLHVANNSWTIAINSSTIGWLGHTWTIVDSSSIVRFLFTQKSVCRS
jgi:hypothetical protein